MALVLLRDENEGRDKHVESTLFPRLDEGSIPSSSTNKNRHHSMPIFICGAMLFYLRATHGTQKGASITKVMRCTIIRCLFFCGYAFLSTCYVHLLLQNHYKITITTQFQHIFCTQSRLLCILLHLYCTKILLLRSDFCTPKNNIKS